LQAGSKETPSFGLIIKQRPTQKETPRVKKGKFLGTILPPKMADFEFFRLGQPLKNFREKR